MKYKFALLISALSLLSLSSYGQLMKIRTIAGTGIEGYSNDGFIATTADLHGPVNIAVDPSGNPHFVDFFNNRVRKINITNDIINTVAGSGIGGNNGDSSLATNANLDPQAVAFDKHGNMYIANAVYKVIRKVNTVGVITTIAGKSMIQSYTGDGGPAVNATFGFPNGLAVDTFGNIFIADATNNVVRKINTAGIISTVAGNDTAGFSGDGGPATDARLDSPYAVATDLAGNLYITDYKNGVIRKVDDTGGISTYAGMNGMYSYTGDNGAANFATLNNPAGICTDTAGNLYIADAHNNVIRKVNKAGIISTVAGNGSAGFGGDLGNALGANLRTPFAVACDKAGNIFVCDADNQRIREVYRDNLSVNNVFTGNGVDLYPNPSATQITLSGLAKADKVYMYDLMGRQVNAWDVAADGAQTFSVQSLAAGVYMLRVFDAEGNGKAVAQLVKE